MAASNALVEIALWVAGCSLNTRNSWKTRLRISFSLSTAERLIQDFDTLFILWFPVFLLRGISQWARVAYVCHYAGEREK